MAKKKKFSLGSGINTVLTKIDSETIDIGFADVDIWVTTGNYALNRMMSGRYDVGLLFGRQYVYFGESGSGKTIQAAYVCANAQRDLDAFVVWIDVERSNTGQAGKKALSRLGVDVSEENFAYLTAATLQDINQIAAETVKYYREVRKAGDMEEPRPLIFVVDSWGATLTESQWEKAQSGDMTADRGQHTKQTGDLIKKINHLVGNIPVLTIGINHIYDNQERHPQTGRVIGRKHKTTGGHKMIFFASGVLMLNKLQLKGEKVESESTLAKIAKMDEKTLKNYKMGGTKTVGIISQAENLKSRVAKPFETVDIQIPWFGGMDPYSGLLGMLMAEGTVYVPSKGWRAYIDKDGNEKKFQEGSFRSLANDIMAAAPYDIVDAADTFIDEYDNEVEDEEVTEEVSE